MNHALMGAPSLRLSRVSCGGQATANLPRNGIASGIDKRLEGLAMYRILAVLTTVIVLASPMVADEAPPTLSLSKAAKLAEDAIAAASLPADCFLRSISLIQQADGSFVYQATYKPTNTAVQRVQVPRPEPQPIIREVIQITMDGKVSFEKFQGPQRQRVRVINDR